MLSKYVLVSRCIALFYPTGLPTKAYKTIETRASPARGQEVSPSNRGYVSPTTKFRVFLDLVLPQEEGIL